MKRGKTALLSMRCAAQRGHAPKAEMQDVSGGGNKEEEEEEAQPAGSHTEEGQQQQRVAAALRRHGRAQ
eukprot:CAMPEP_0206509552 /NCGR_PEP_ID=MMETSP0324_2-20121206/58999_1 /ASSEMBLY_ACC=CAM_ASM_000836 /TAXON_ID=2866 /ORGANISM="Crypthecodinium cohnii, Strain Seligo" /LENGTH=68 /DNA_ID=CAMNT_0054000635 /DNA_START=205 /DNA_END=412 /DNA_ORIENTATION=-